MGIGVLRIGLAGSGLARAERPVWMRQDMLGCGDSGFVTARSGRDRTAPVS